MAKSLLTNARLWMDGYDLSGSVSGTAIQMSAPALETTNMASLAQEFAAGLPTVSMTHEGYVEYGTGLVNDVMHNRVGVAGTLITVALSSLPGADAFSFLALTTSYSPGAPVGEMLTYSAAAQG